MRTPAPLLKRQWEKGEADPGPYDVLAEILVSRRIGLAHVRLVVAVIVAMADLNEGPAENSEPVSLSDWADIVERALDSEDKYEESWSKLRQTDDAASADEKLNELQNALCETVSTSRNLRQELDARRAS